MDNWTFTEPFRLLLLLFIPLCILFYKRYWREKQPVILISQVPEQGFTKNTAINPQDVFFTLKLAVLFLIILALANPVLIRKEKQVLTAADVDVVFALDVSGSMLLEDIKPNRLEALKDVISRFTASRPKDKFGLVIYAGESMVWSPITRDASFLLKKINAIDKKEMADGTAIGLGLASAINSIKNSKAKNKVVILLTDGENNTGFIEPLTASAMARKYQIKVYTIGMGTTGKAPMPVIDFEGNKSYQYVDVKLDEGLLKKIAAETGAHYFRATDAQTLENIYSKINQLEKTNSNIQYLEVEEPKYRLFVISALLLLLLRFILNFTWFKTFN